MVVRSATILTTLSSWHEDEQSYSTGRRSASRQINWATQNTIPDSIRRNKILWTCVLWWAIAFFIKQWCFLGIIWGKLGCIYSRLNLNLPSLPCNEACCKNIVH
jgi:hypothetical protein